MKFWLVKLKGGGAEYACATTAAGDLLPIPDGQPKTCMLTLLEDRRGEIEVSATSIDVVDVSSVDVECAVCFRSSQPHRDSRWDMDLDHLRARS